MIFGEREILSFVSFFPLLLYILRAAEIMRFMTKSLVYIQDLCVFKFTVEFRSIRNVEEK